MPYAKIRGAIVYHERSVGIEEVEIRLTLNFGNERHGGHGAVVS